MSQAGWNNNLALVWTKMVGPSRPAISELEIYSKHAREIQKTISRKLKLLVLGSTPEFRDWGFENNFDITVLDCNKDYNKAIFREIRHKGIKERTIIDRWQNLDAKNEYDIIIGDLVIGNIAPNELDDFFHRIMTALTQNGIFLGKSFYKKANYSPLDIEDLVKKYYSGHPWHPYSFFVYDLTLSCLDENNMLSFSKQYEVLRKLNEKGILHDNTFEYFKEVGWDKEMKFLFHVPDLEAFEQLAEKYLKIYAIEYGKDIYSEHFPLHIIGRKDNILFREAKKQ